MSDAPAVSVVISSFNRAASVPATVEGLLRQQVPSDLVFEIIVVDNNSTDNTRDVVEAIAARHPGRVRYIFEGRQGVSYGRNAGIQTARAPIVAFTDDDNVAAPNWIATLSDALDRHPEAAAVGGRVVPQWPGPLPRWLDRRHWSPLAILDYGDRPFFTSADDPRCLLTANLAVRREVFAHIGEFSPDFPRCQDHELLIRLWRSGGRALYMPELVVYAPVDPERMTRRYHRKWHVTHGRFTAAMRLQEIIDGQGRLIEGGLDVPRLFGNPGFVYRGVLWHAARSLKAWIIGDEGGAAAHADAVRYLVSYIRQTARAHNSRRRWLSDPLLFVGAHFARWAR